MSTREEIIKVLCDTNLFRPNDTYILKDIIDIVVKNLPKNAIAKVQNIDDSIREALETIDGYSFSNNSSVRSQRSMIKTKIPSSRSPHGYYIEYTFL